MQNPKTFDGQSKMHSALESVLNTLIGYGISVGAQMVIFPLVGIQANFSQNLLLGLIFTVVSLVRSYFLRRLFNYLHIRRMVSEG